MNYTSAGGVSGYVSLMIISDWERHTVDDAIISDTSMTSID